MRAHSERRHVARGDATSREVEQVESRRGRIGEAERDLEASPDLYAPGGAVHAFTVYDCEVPSGTCEELGPLDPEGGDPMFIGNDM